MATSRLKSRKEFTSLSASSSSSSSKTRKTLSLKRKKRDNKIKTSRTLNDKYFNLFNNQKLFAYTYLFVPLEVMQTYNLVELNEYIIKKNKVCDAFSKTKQMIIPGTVSAGEMIITPTSYLILIMKYNVASDIEEYPEYLKDSKILQQILGHATVHVNLEKRIAGIFDVCLHDLKKSGYGSVIMSLVLSCIEHNFKNVIDTIFLGILLENVQFEKVSYLYTSVGFQDPLITDTDMLGQKYPYELMFLTKNIHHYMNDEARIERNYHLLMDVYSNYKAKRTCSLFFQFDKSVIYRARLFPYIGLDGIKGFTQPKEKFREHAGAFTIVNSKREGDQTIFKLGLETIAENGGLKYITGQEEEVAYVESLYCFHTHPVNAYLKYGWILATPSSPDFRAFFVRAIKGISYFHTVITVEGIYILSFSEAFISQYKGNYASFDNIDYRYFDKFEYPSQNRMRIGLNLEEMVEENIQKYFVWLNSMNSENMFHVQFFYWKNLTKDTIIQIHYMNLKNACYPEFPEI